MRARSEEEPGTLCPAIHPKLPGYLTNPAVQHPELPRPPMISIVDDDECAREATAGVIRSLGYALGTYASAEDFLGSDHVRNTSCLISDVHLPGLSGLELYQHLRANGFVVPTIFVTGCPDETTRTQALAA